MIFVQSMVTVQLNKESMNNAVFLNLNAVVSEYIHSFLITAINLGKHLFFLMLLTGGDLYICCCLPSPSSHVLIIHITTLQYSPFTCFKSLSEIRTISDIWPLVKKSLPPNCF